MGGGGVYMQAAVRVGLATKRGGAGQRLQDRGSLEGAFRKTVSPEHLMEQPGGRLQEDGQSRALDGAAWRAPSGRRSVPST